MNNDVHDVSYNYTSVKGALAGLDLRYSPTKDVSLEASGNYLAGQNVNGGSITGAIKFFF